MHLNPSYLASDRVLLFALVIAAVLVLNGIWWGWVECWNPDQMALHPLLLANRRPLEPAGFLKPPFHTYLNFFLSVLPLKALEKVIEALTGSNLNFDFLILWWSRLIQLALFIGTIIVSHRIVERSSGKFPARIVALITATSAGFVLQAHFLTADIPVTFWMIASFLCAQSIAIHGRMRDYALAGLLTGVATATKYNGLVVGLAIPIFHCFANYGAHPRKLALDVRLIVGISAVVVGFVLANPYSVFKFTTFAADFMYNYVTTPVYGGMDIGGTGYLLFAFRIVEVLGWPVALIATAAFIATLASIKRLSPMERTSVVAALGVFALYFLKFGAPPRVEVRFVLPVVPLLLIVAAPFFANFGKRFRLVIVGFLSVVLSYNLVASSWIGYRFASDPRMGAQAWIATNVPPGTVIESSPYSPHWNKYPGIVIKDVRMPFVSTRNRMFSQLFTGDSGMIGAIQEREPENVGWYDAKALASRQPDFIALNSLYYDRFLHESSSMYYPEISEFMEKLLAGKLGYEVVYDESSRGSPGGLYPREIGFVDNRMVILKRAGTALIE